jgi:hypothetical protein
MPFTYQGYSGTRRFPIPKGWKFKGAAHESQQSNQTKNMTIQNNDTEKGDAQKQSAFIINAGTMSVALCLIEIPWVYLGAFEWWVHAGDSDPGIAGMTLISTLLAIPSLIAIILGALALVRPPSGFSIVWGISGFILGIGWCLYFTIGLLGDLHARGLLR